MTKRSNIDLELEYLLYVIILRGKPGKGLIHLIKLSKENGPPYTLLSTFLDSF